MARGLLGTGWKLSEQWGLKIRYGRIGIGDLVEFFRGYSCVLYRMMGVVGGIAGFAFS